MHKGGGKADFLKMWTVQVKSSGLGFSQENVLVLWDKLCMARSCLWICRNLEDPKEKATVRSASKWGVS